MSSRARRTSARTSRYRRTTTLIASLRDTDNDPTGLPHRDGRTDRQRRSERRRSRTAQAQEEEKEEEEEEEDDVDGDEDNAGLNGVGGDDDDDNDNDDSLLQPSPAASRAGSRSSSRIRTRSTGRKRGVRRSNTLIASLRNTDNDPTGLVHRDGTSDRDRRHSRRSTGGGPAAQQGDEDAEEEQDQEQDQEQEQEQEEQPHAEAEPKPKSRVRSRSSGRKGRLRRTNTLIASLRGHEDDGLRALVHRDGTVGGHKPKAGGTSASGPVRRSSRRSARVDSFRSDSVRGGDSGEALEEEDEEQEEEAPAQAPLLRSKKKAPRRRAARPKSVGRKKRSKSKKAKASDKSESKKASVDVAALAASVVRACSSAALVWVGAVTTAVQQRYTRWQGNSDVDANSAQKSKSKGGGVLGALIALLLLFVLFRGRGSGKDRRRVDLEPPPAAASSAEGFAYWKESLLAYEERIATLETKYSAALAQLVDVEKGLRKQTSACAASVAAGAADAVDKATAASRDELKKTLAKTATALRKEVDTKVADMDKAASNARAAAGKQYRGEVGKQIKAAVADATTAAKKDSDAAVKSSAASLQRDIEALRAKASVEIEDAVAKSATAQAAARAAEIETALAKIREELKSEATRHDKKVKELHREMTAAAEANAVAAAAASSKRSVGAAGSGGEVEGIDAKTLLQRENALAAGIRAELGKEMRKLEKELAGIREDLTSLVGKEIEGAAKRQGDAVAALKESMASLRAENTAFFGKGAFGGHQSAKNLEAAAKKMAQAAKSARKNANANKKGGSSRTGGDAGTGAGYFGGSAFGGQIGASFDRVDEAIKALDAAQRDSEAELQATVEKLRKEMQGALEARIKRMEAQSSKDAARALKQSSAKEADSAGRGELKRLLESSNEKLAADIAASKKDLASLSTRLDTAGKVLAKDLDKTLGPVRKSLAALEGELAALQESAGKGSKDALGAAERAQAAAQKSIDVVAADVEKAVRGFEAQNVETMSELKKVQGELAALRGAAAGAGAEVGAGAGDGDGEGLVEANSDLIKGWIKRIVAQQKKELVSRGVSGGRITREMVDSWIQEQMLTFAADRTGKVDFAVQSSGARIVQALTSSTFLNPNTTFVRKLARGAGLAVHHGPEQVLKPSSEIGR